MDEAEENAGGQGVCLGGGGGVGLGQCGRRGWSCRVRVVWDDLDV
jgi:hypothetical protein